ncbi:hypothetical protein DAPPUDRAFT_228265 [Daphnia pulex]|uniref:Uncharacterized protein n=1 Tax=Daphnia pulex TaxID=6669 RepID=E9HCE0_DAPPU|nr:hypothetical protein DAPPUDRAFT_228265 [Daphnia pulex]|eukprot:EFX70605.1 hypothetical protein DAPPUDRAFT_228265 [Daphnia pulex]
MSYSFRHGAGQKNPSSTSSSSTCTTSGGHQRIAYGSRSTSTGTPPQTPTIRVTSPVPDVVGMIDIWDPEVVEDEPPPPSSTSSTTSPKAYSFRYKEEKQHKQRKHHATATTQENPTINFSDSAIIMQADPVELTESPSSTAQPPIEATIIDVNQIGDALSPIDDDGLKTAGESEESSDCEEISQISAVTQIPRGESSQHQEPSSPQVAEEPADPLILPEAKILPVVPSHSPQRIIWEEMQSPSTEAGKPVKRVQFSRSLSLVPGSSAAQQTASVEGAGGVGGVGIIRPGAGRRYSSLDSSSNPVSSHDIFPSMLTFIGEQQHHHHHHPSSAAIISDRKMLSPTPESALESAQSPQQESPIVAPKMDHDELDELQSRADDEPDSTMTTLAATVEEVGGVEGMTNHDPTCDLFDRLNALKNDEELMDLATGFVLQLLRSAQEETLRRGHVASKMEQKSKLSLELQHVAVPKGRHNRKWYSRLRMLLLRTLTCTCVPTHPNIQSPLSN